MDDEVWALCNHVEVIVSDERCDLHNYVSRLIEASHFQIHPNKHDCDGIGRTALDLVGARWETDRLVS
jgi:hypothetical protein